MRADVEALGSLPSGSQALVATALSLARELDGRNSATSKSMCARALVETLNLLRDLAPSQAVSSPLDEIRARRDARLARQA